MVPSREGLTKNMSRKDYARFTIPETFCRSSVLEVAIKLIEGVHVARSSSGNYFFRSRSQEKQQARLYKKQSAKSKLIRWSYPVSRCLMA